MESLKLCCYGVEICVRDDAGLGIVKELQSSLPPEFVPSDGSSSTVVDYLVTSDNASPAAGGQEYVVSCNHHEVFATQNDDEVFDWLRRDIHQSIARGSTEYVFVHAAVVGWRGLAIVIPGRPSGGKSTLVAELVRRGAVFYSDLFAAFDDEARVHAYRATPELNAESKVHELRLVRDDPPASLPVGLIVAGAYAPGHPWQPRIVRGAHAALPLIDNTVLPRESVSRIHAIAARIADDAITLRGPRPEASDVAPQLLDLVDDAFVSRALDTVGDARTRMADDLASVADTRVYRPGLRPTSPPRQLVVTPYLQVPDFLSSADHARLVDHALANEPSFKDSSVIDDDGQFTVDNQARRSRTLSGAPLAEVWPLFEERLRAMLPYVRQQLRIPWFALGRIERQMNVHGDGGLFVPHTDTDHPLAADRRISCVYYFNRFPRRFDGGELRLYDTWVTPDGTTGAATHTTLTPIDNRVVFFPSESFHEVRPVRTETPTFGDSRFTVTIWFRDAAMS